MTLNGRVNLCAQWRVGPRQKATPLGGSHKAWDEKIFGESDLYILGETRKIYFLFSMRQTKKADYARKSQQTKRYFKRYLERRLGYLLFRKLS